MATVVLLGNSGAGKDTLAGCLGQPVFKFSYYTIKNTVATLFGDAEPQEAHKHLVVSSPIPQLDGKTGLELMLDAFGQSENQQNIWYLVGLHHALQAVKPDMTYVDVRKRVELDRVLAVDPGAVVLLVLGGKKLASDSPLALWRYAAVNDAKVGVLDNTPESWERNTQPGYVKYVIESVECFRSDNGKGSLWSVQYQLPPGYTVSQENA